MRFPSRRARYDIPKRKVVPDLRSSKFKLGDKSNYVHYGHCCYDENVPRENYWTPQIISQLHYQSETGKTPVSGGGYGGEFAGSGFEGIWFDMSEIVRPTRDGIDGREYISTEVDLGRKPEVLALDGMGKIKNKINTVAIPFPVIFNYLPFKLLATGAQMAILKSASSLGTYAVLPQGHCTEAFLPFAEDIMLRLSDKPNEIEQKLISKGRLVELRHSKDYGRVLKSVRSVNPKIITSVYLNAGKDTEDTVLGLARDGVEVVHLKFDYYGAGQDGRLIPDVVKSVNQALVDEGIRNELSIIVGGGIASAEHVAKTIICGADAVSIDYALLVGLGCSLWADQVHPCPVEHRQVEPDLGFNRISNLMRAWRNQLIEVLGAMGIREIRRMRGELGRAIFYDVEEEEFRKLFKTTRKIKYIKPRHEPVAGDCRWPFWLLQSSFKMAATGDIPGSGECWWGASGGGFDRLAFTFEEGDDELADDESIDLSLDLNKREWGKKITIPQPIIGGGMSFGSVSTKVMQARAMAAHKIGTFMCTGEGGYPDILIPYKDNIITQVATGLFGVKEETMQRSPIIEFKYAQGAKPGLGGHLLGGKVTESVAEARETVVGKSLFSPFPFHSVYSVEDHKKHVDWAFEVNNDALVIVKVSTPSDVEMVAVGSYYADAHIINIDGSYGGTGAAPEIAKKNIALPLEYAIPKVHSFLEAEGVRDEILLMAGGGIRSGYDIAKAIALGADGVMIGTADLVALGCERLGVCEKGDGCPLGLTTTDPKEAAKLDPHWGAKRIVNLRKAWMKQLRMILAKYGLKSIRELRGRKDLLLYLEEGEDR
ncbi:glutamate synthase-related protein [Candidatus Altiarchaeota archaeon]